MRLSLHMGNKYGAIQELIRMDDLRSKSVQLQYKPVVQNPIKAIF